MRSIIDNDVRMPLPAKCIEELRFRLRADLHLAAIVRILPAVGIDIPRSRQNLKILGRDDTEIVRHLIAVGSPVPWHLLA
jgi:hypothetical protein